MTTLHQYIVHRNRVRELYEQLTYYGNLSYSELGKLKKALADHGEQARKATLYCKNRAPRQLGLDYTLCSDPECHCCASLRREPPRFVYSDGGRKSSGYTRQSKKGDCVIRSIAIATYKPYTLVRDDLNERACRLLDVADYGIDRDVYEPYLAEIGWKWTPTMSVGAGTTVHLRAEELPPGRLIVAVSRHLTAVVDGTIHDTYDPSRGGTRCVYGYYRKA